MIGPLFAFPDRCVEDGTYKVEYLAPQSCLLGEGPIWSEEHDCWYFVDAEKKSAAMYRLRPGSEPEALTLSGDYKIGSMSPTNLLNTFICVLQNDGFAKLVVEPDSTDVDVNLLWCNPIVDEAVGDGKHSETERFNDGKTSPDGKFFAGSVDPAAFMNPSGY